MTMLEGLVPASRGSEIAEAIDVLAREGLFADPGRRPGERIRFKHAMICDAVYNTLLSSDRRRLHSDAADFLSRNYAGTPDAASDVIAEHLSKAGRYVEAIRMRLSESVSTAARGAYIETEGHCVAALALVDSVVDPQQRAALQFRLLVQLGVALTGRHGYSARVVEDVYQRAYAVCDDKTDAETLYPIMRGLLAVNFMHGELATAYDLSKQGMELAEKSKRVEFCLDALSMLCYTNSLLRTPRGLPRFDQSVPATLQGRARGSPFLPGAAGCRHGGVCYSADGLVASGRRAGDGGGCAGRSCPCRKPEP